MLRPAGGDSWMRRRPRRVCWMKCIRRDGVGHNASVYWSSQTGRWLRDFVYEGFNTDERNRRVFDAVMPHLGGGAGVLLNQRWSTPTYAADGNRDALSVLGPVEAAGSRYRRRGRSCSRTRAPVRTSRRFSTCSDTEYWERGVALSHTTPDGSKDVAPPANVRLYHFAGAPHNIGRFPPAATNGGLADNPHDLRSHRARCSSRWRSGCAMGRRLRPAGIRGCRMERSYVPRISLFRICLE